MFYVIYKIVNNINGKIYIGAHQTCNLNDGYMGSGLAIKRAIIKHGIQSFSKEILFSFENKQEMFDKEKELVNEDFISAQHTYNIKVGGSGGFSKEQSSKGRIRANEVMLEKYGEDYTKIITTKAREQADSNMRELYGDDFRTVRSRMGRLAAETKRANNPELVGTLTQVAHTASLSATARAKRKETMTKNNHQQGEKNSQFGTMWITNSQLQENKKISKEEIIPDGWIKGRKRYSTIDYTPH